MPVFGFGAVPLKQITGWPYSVRLGNATPIQNSDVLKSPDNSGPLVSKIMNFESMLESKT